MEDSARPILIIGSSGHAKVSIDAIERSGAYRIVGLIDSFRRIGESAFGYAILGGEENLPEIVRAKDANAGFIAIGDNWQRSLVAARIGNRLPGFEFVTVSHPSAQIARGVKLGHGTIILPGAVVNADARIGNFCIVNTNASLDHESVMEDFSSLGPNAAISGNVQIGAYSAICLSASVIQKCQIGAHTVIGAGAVVTRNIPDETMAFGAPAKVVRRRTKGEFYL